MMENGNIFFDIMDEERDKMTVDDLLKLFKERSGHELDNDRILLS